MPRPYISEMPFTVDPTGVVNKPFRPAIEALSPTAWFEYRDETLTSSVVAGVDLLSQWASRLGAGAWAQATDNLKPQRAVNGARFKQDANDVMGLSGVTFPAGDHTLLVVETTDADDTGTSYVVGAAGAPNTRHALYRNTVAGGSIVAAVGAVTTTQASAFGVPTWHLMGYRAEEKTTFLETRGGMLTTVTDAVAAAPIGDCFMGGSNNLGSSPWKGTIHAVLILPTCVFALDPTTAAAQAESRAMLKRYGAAVARSV